VPRTIVVPERVNVMVGVPKARVIVKLETIEASADVDTQ
jgi:hypothetical protein